MILPVSIGEALDKYSILEIKLDSISDDSKKRQVADEIEQLISVKEYRIKYSYYYKLLRYVNEKIWTETEYIKLLNPGDINFANKSYNIFEMNQQRFRLKNMVNNLEVDSIKEQKSYTENSVFLRVNNIGIAVPVIHYLSVMYDLVILENAEILSNIFKTPNIIFSSEKNLTSLTETDVITPEIFIPEVIFYLAGGRIGDFLHQLSVVYEKFLQTGKKGRIFISGDVGDAFQRGLEETCNDIHPIISDLPYIESLRIHRGESCHFNLSSWRMQPDIFLYSWQEIFYFSYDVDWGKNAWLDAPVNDELKDVILISTNARRWNNIDWTGLLNKIDGPVMFLEVDSSEYRHFCTESNQKIEALNCKTFTEIAIAIRSCKMLVATLSMTLAIADAMKKQRIAIMPPSDCPDNFIAKKTNSNWIDENTVFNS
jgi:hypothetical protein